MSKQVKEMLVEEYRKRLSGVDDAVLVDIREVDANTNNEMRRTLKTKDIRVTVLRNSLAKSAFKDTALTSFDPLLIGPSAIVYGGESVVNVAREIVDWSKKIKQIQLKGAILDGDLYEGKSGVEALSNFPTREEAQGQVVQLVMSPAQQLIGAAIAPGGNIVGIVKELIDKLEKGETVAKVG